MTRVLRNPRVEVELGDAAWTLRWPALGITLGPCTSAVPGPGAWQLSTTADGATARFTGPAGWLELEVPTDGPLVGLRAETARGEGSVLLLDGPVDPAPLVQLVDGYDSWSYAGVRSAGAAVRSWWRLGLALPHGALALAACEAARLCTTFELRHGRVRADAGGTPVLAPVEGTWGHEQRDAPALAAGPGPLLGEPLVIGAATDGVALLEDVAARVERRRWAGPPVSGWESWYHYGLAVSPDHVLANARLLRDRFGGRPGFDLVQIDDGWQQTYGAWWPNERWTRLSDVVDELHRLGLRAGLWLAPFMVQPGAPGFGADQADWFVRDEQGAPLVDRHGRFGLDASAPAVLDWLRDLGARVRAYGVEMVKLDFLYLGAQEGGRHDRRATGVEALRAGLRALTAPLGDGVYVLTCGAPMLPVVGIAHANRVGHDLAVPVLLRAYGQPLAEGWAGWSGVKAQARQVIARAALHGRWFHADPDVVMAWGSEDPPDGYSLEESRTLAVLAALCGGPFLLADELSALTRQERQVLEDPEVLDLAWDERGFRPVDLFDHLDETPSPLHAFAQPRDLPSVWVAERHDTTVTALFNWTDTPAHRRAPGGPTVEVPAHGVHLVT